MANLTNKESVQVNASSRATEQSFTPQIPNNTIGPPASADSAKVIGEAIAVNSDAAVTVYTWKVMTTGDAGLKSAIYDFINTSKEGVKVTPDVVHGREKKLVFNFFGTMGKSIQPGEIGEFEVVFSYPPTVGTGPLGNVIPNVITGQSRS